LATIEQLERRAAELEQAEVRAVRALVEQTREVAVSLPDGSTLALSLVRVARRLEDYADTRRARYAGAPLTELFNDLSDQLPPAEEPD
jgi:hypothetical protein